MNTSALGYSYLTAPAPAPRASCTTRTARQECINTRPNVELGVSSKLTHKYQHPDFPNGPRSRDLQIRRNKKLHFPQGASRTRIQEEGTIGPKLYTATTSERVSKMPPRFRINRLFEQGRPSSDSAKSVQTRPIREWLVPTGPQGRGEDSEHLTCIRPPLYKTLQLQNRKYTTCGKFETLGLQNQR